MTEDLLIVGCVLVAYAVAVMTVVPSITTAATLDQPRAANGDRAVARRPRRR